MQKSPKTIYSLIKTMGYRWVLFRLYYLAITKFGLLERRTPLAQWGQRPLANELLDKTLSDPERYLEYRRNNAPLFLFKPDNRGDYANIFDGWDTTEKNPTKEATRLLDGKFQFFSSQEIDLGKNPDWHKNPYTGEQAPPNVHWLRIDDFSYGDIKAIWEPNRFGFVYDLVRAYWRTGDEHYPECFWHLVQSWKEANPPNHGVNWKCGQEISFRLMALCFGLYGFVESPRTTADRVSSLAQIVAASGHRIEANIDYALSQQNNHGISEATGLFTIGLLFPEFKDSEKWRDMGRELLAKQASDLIYDDGSFSQHSFNYQRLMLHDYLWAARLGNLNGFSLSDELITRICNSANLVYQVQDDDTGNVPIYGSDDGALILPLNNCDCHDFRPLIQALHYLANGNLPFENGPWEEDLLWLFGPDALDAPRVSIKRTDFSAKDGGYYTLRSTNGLVFTRCAEFRHRPSHADLLHVDLWHNGENVAIDPGVYSYNNKQPWDDAFFSGMWHNTVTVDGLDQMSRIGRFLWAPWATGKVIANAQTEKGCLACFEATHDGYERLDPTVKYSRSVIRLGEENWLILDDLSSDGPHDYRLHWLFPDYVYEWDAVAGRLFLDMHSASYHVLLYSTPNNSRPELVRADPNSKSGWRSLNYYSKSPALSVTVTAQGEKVRFFTIFGPEPTVFSTAGQNIRITSHEWESEIILNEVSNGGPFIKSISLTGDVSDYLVPCI